jgi:hypothetical protein
MNAQQIINRLGEVEVLICDGKLVISCFYICDRLRRFEQIEKLEGIPYHKNLFWARGFSKEWVGFNNANELENVFLQLENETKRMIDYIFNRVFSSI